MKNVIYAVLALILMPFTIALLLGVFTGALTGGIQAASNTDVVYGYSLATLREIEPTDEFPGSVLIDTNARAATTAAFGRDVQAQLDRVFIASGSHEDIIDFYDNVMTEDGYRRIGTPTPMNAQNTEEGVMVWRRGNVYFRISFESDTRTMLEAGGDLGDTMYKVYITPYRS